MQSNVVRSRRNLIVFELMVSSALMWVFLLPVRANESVTLAWNASADPQVAGYKIYSGPASHSYASVLMVGNTTNATVTGLVPGATYYFAATTVDRSGAESGYSNETQYTVPVTPAALTTATLSGGQFSVNVSGDASQQYVVQASTDLVNWVSLQTNTAPFTFTDPNAAAFSQRFYRALYLAP